MKLTIHERLEVEKVLPAQGSFGTLRAIRKIHEALEFKPEEVKDFGIKSQEIMSPYSGQIMTNWSWKPEASAIKVEVVLEPLGEQFLAGLLKKLAGQEKLPATLLDLALELNPEAKA